MKLQLGVFYGGRSCEHDVSIVTGHQAMDNADASKYDVVPVYLGADGVFYTGAGLRDMGCHEHFENAKDVHPCVLVKGGKGAVLMTPPREGLLNRARRLATLDAALLAFHGMHGEDGTVQGLLELLDLPYTSAAVMGSAVGMDKITMKAVFRGNGFPVLGHCWFERDDWERDREGTLRSIEGTLQYPIFVKPANLGSSIGISKAADRIGLDEAIDVALSYDRRVLCEQGVEDPMELNCACVGYGGGVKASLIEEPIGWREFLTFEDKYIAGGKGKGGSPGGMAEQKRRIPAPISKKLTEEIQQLSLDIFRTLDLKGVVRIDYLVDKTTGALYINEANTIPGSLAYYLFEPMGIPFPALIDLMVEGALAAHRDKEKLTYAFDSAILKQVNAGHALKK